jgi:V-type H+-transporting ATPase subunit C
VAFALRRIELPTGLMVGTLDSLMSLSDELVRVDSLVENVVRKVSNT